MLLLKWQLFRKSIVSDKKITYESPVFYPFYPFQPIFSGDWKITNHSHDLS